MLQEFDVRGGGPQTPASSLSAATSRRSSWRGRSTGTRKPVARPADARLDVGAIEFVHRRLVQERDEGRAILLVSLELEEVSRSPTAFS